MPALITRRFRLYNAQNFKEAFTETSPDILYLFIGRLQPWPNGDTAPEPQDTLSDVRYDPWRNMLAAKKISTNDMSYAIRRYDWTSGTVYTEFDNNNANLYDSNYFVLTNDDNVYKCMFNNRRAASTVKPTGTSTSLITTSDGYIWKYMYSLTAAEILKFETPSYIPVKTLTADDSSAQWDVQQAAVNGAIEIIDVVTNGINYISRSNTFASITNSSILVLDSGASNDDDKYTGSSLFISSGLGAGQVRKIINYVASTKSVTVNTGFTTTPNSSSTFLVSPTVTITGDGSGALAYANVATNGQVIKINMINVGSNYSKAAAVVSANSGSGATLDPRVSPPGGHGSDPVSELAGHNVMLNLRLVGTEGGNFPSNNDFRMLGLIKNPLLANSGTAASDAAYDQTTQLTLTGVTGGIYTQDEIVTGGTSGAIGRVVLWANTNSTGTKGYIKITDIDGTFANLELITGNTSSVTANVNGITSGELQLYSGDVLYIENRKASARSVDQIEDVKLTMRF